MAAEKSVGWDARPRTTLRNVRPGDLFLFRLGEERYGAGRIVSAVSLGHVAEFFDVELKEPNIKRIDWGCIKRRGRLVILDSYGLFDRKAEGDWRIVGHDDTFNQGSIEPTYFTYGDGAGRRKVDIFDSETSVSAEEARHLPPYAPFGDGDVKSELYTSRA